MHSRHSQAVGHALFALLMVTTATAPSAAVPAKANPAQTPLLLLSMDGFRHDYLTLFASSTPNLNRLANGEGAYAAKLQPAYVTKTAANHWSIVTGLYQESHGVVNNQVFDPEFNETTDMLLNDEERWWNGTEPLWLTAEKHGLRAGVHKWPGGKVAFNGSLPTYMTPWTPPTETTPGLDVSLNVALEWLANGKVNLAAIYHHEPDFTAHGYGPAAVGPVLAQLDAAIGRFLDGLQQRGLSNRVNVIITSDHGMLAVNQSNTILVNASGHPATRTIIALGVALGLFARPGRVEELRSAMQRELEGQPVSVLLRDELPDRLHYKGHRRIPDLLLLPTDKARPVADVGDRLWKKGMHGGDNEWEEMQVPLLAVGPGFTRGARAADGARQVDVYGLACRLLGLPARPNNGSEQPLAGLLASGAVGAGRPADGQGFLMLLPPLMILLLLQ